MSKNSITIFGKKYIPDGRVKRLLRKSPPANKRAIAIGKCARGKNLVDRKKCFENPYGKKIAPKVVAPKPTSNLYGLYKQKTGKPAKVGRNETRAFQEWKSKR